MEFANKHGGWQVSGYHKTGSPEENIATYINYVRICRFTPAIPTPESNHGDNVPNMQNANVANAKNRKKFRVFLKDLTREWLLVEVFHQSKRF